MRKRLFSESNMEWDNGRLCVVMRCVVNGREKEEKDSPEADENADYESHAKKIAYADMKKDDYYRVLGLEDLKWRATDDQIRTSYRKLVLKYHPDKMTNSAPDDRQIFLRVQDAYDILGNTEKRRA